MSEFSISYVSSQRLSSHTCPLASYTAGNSVPTCGLHLRSSRLTHRSYRPSGGLHMRMPRTRHMLFACNCPEPEAWKAESSGLAPFSVSKTTMQLVLTTSLQRSLTMVTMLYTEGCIILSLTAGPLSVSLSIGKCQHYSCIQANG